MRRQVQTALLMVGASAFVVLMACGQGGDPTPASTATVFPTATSTVASVATPTQTSVRSSSLRVDDFTCERFSPGVPNPDGPNEWLNTGGVLTNTGEVELEFASDDAPIIIDLIDLDGKLISTLEVEVTDKTLPAGNSMRFDAAPVNSEHPSLQSCKVNINLAHTVPAPLITGATQDRSYTGRGHDIRRSLSLWHTARSFRSPTDEILELDMTTGEAMQITLSGGIVMPRAISRKKLELT